jgi:hypothetical protein
MNLKKCDGCRVARWFFDTFGVIICTENCPYKKDGESNG